MSFFCSRILHMTRIDTSGEIYPCCAMINNPKFPSLDEMRKSAWYANILENQNKGKWPSECTQCQDEENHGQISVRNVSNRKHEIYKKLNENYRILDISTDNICNAACQTCGPGSSSLYAKTIGKKKLIRNKGIDQLEHYLDNDVVQIELVGGEPLYSKSYLKVLTNVPESVQWIRVNTNGSVYYDFTDLLERVRIVELTVSLDGTGKVFEYIRWPLKWDQVELNFSRWLELKNKYPKKFKLSINMTVSALNIAHLDVMRKWASNRQVGIHFNYLKYYDVINIKYRNRLTERAINVKYNFPIACDRNNDDELKNWLEKNDKFRKINYKDYLGDNNG